MIERIGGFSRFGLTLLLLLALAGTTAWADGKVSGTVRDADGNPLGGALVRVAGGQQQATTADDGGYSLSLPAGSYRIVVVIPGYAASGETVTVTDDGSTELDFELRETLSQFGEQIVVLGSRCG